jgi:hypothetical protein
LPHYGSRNGETWVTRFVWNDDVKELSEKLCEMVDLSPDVVYSITIEPTVVRVKYHRVDDNGNKFVDERGNLAIAELNIPIERDGDDERDRELAEALLDPNVKVYQY